ncbi:hypothetical protein JQ625_31615 [Bradyrhizobium diazoefficiens]|nr:hypothetical protein [Bradyrhizobium diazoefficiens]MBR0779390.1 hypothetical protein [Bradyrhizobium diazoefficiens]
MPVVRYVVFVGGLLLALLFAADHYFPPVSAPASVAEVDRSVIRIASTRPVPERIVFDVSQPPVLAPAIAANDAHDRQSPHDALAMMPKDNSIKDTSIEHRAIEAAPARAVTTGVAKRQRAARSYRMARRTFERRAALDRREFFGGW